MDENTACYYPRAAAGLLIMCAASVVSNLGSQLYYWDIFPMAGLLVRIAGSILQFVGMYRAGADEPGFYRALLYAAVSMGLGQMSGYFQMGLFYVSLLIYVAALLMSLRAANLSCAAASRLLRLAGQEPLALGGDVVVKLNIVCYTAAIAGTLTTGLGIGLSYALLILSWVLTAAYLVFLFRAGRVLRARHESA